MQPTRNSPLSAASVNYDDLPIVELEIEPGRPLITTPRDNRNTLKAKSRQVRALGTRLFFQPKPFPYLRWNLSTNTKMNLSQTVFGTKEQIPLPCLRLARGLIDII